MTDARHRAEHLSRAAVRRAARLHGAELLGSRKSWPRGGGFSRWSGAESPVWVKGGPSDYVGITSSLPG